MEQNIESFPSLDRLMSKHCAHGYARSDWPGYGLTLDDFELLRRDLQGYSLVDVQMRL
jgi:hypothetical protein